MAPCHRRIELIDNAVDSISNTKKNYQTEFRYTYQFGKGAKKTLTIIDNAYGMDEEGIESAQSKLLGGTEVGFTIPIGIGKLA